MGISVIELTEWKANSLIFKAIFVSLRLKLQTNKEKRLILKMIIMPVIIWLKYKQFGNICINVMRIIIRHGFNYLTLLVKTFMPFPKSFEWDYLNTDQYYTVCWNLCVGHEIGTKFWMKCVKESKRDLHAHFMNPKRIIVTANKLKRKRQNRLTTLDQSEVIYVFRSFIFEEWPCVMRAFFLRKYGICVCAVLSWLMLAFFCLSNGFS